MIEHEGERPVVLQGGRRHGLIAIAVTLTVLASIACVVWPHAVIGLSYAVPASIYAALRRDDVVQLTDQGIVVRKRRKPERVYRWDDLLEVGWGAGPYRTAGPVVRTVHGTPFESPSPGVPALIARLHLPAQRTRDLLGRVCAQHNVPYSEHMTKDISAGRRPMRLPSDADRRALLDGRAASGD